jgi:ABC-type transport system involved in cytochrome bd biosynthesis fused ATPase/permease subunit
MGLLKESDIYIFDEPLAGIDIDSKNSVMNEIFDRTEDKVLIVIMHGDEQFHKSFDRIVNLSAFAQEEPVQPQRIERLPASASEPQITNSLKRKNRKAKASAL